MAQRSLMLLRLAGTGLIATGVAGIAFPEPLARAFGAPLHDGAPSAFVRATSVRDIALGAITLCASFGKERNILLAASVCGTGISLSDFLSTKKPVHLAGAALFAALAATL
jgi:hypothetical protein